MNSARAAITAKALDTNTGRNQQYFASAKGVPLRGMRLWLTAHQDMRLKEL